MWKPCLKAAFAVLLLMSMSVAACGRQAPVTEMVARIPSEFVAPRPTYSTSRPFRELVKPHFFAASPRGQLVEVLGDPDLVLERDGIVKVRLKQGRQEQYLDLLALESELLGEHPVHKVLRLRAMGVAIAPGLEKRLQLPEFADELFHTIRFEYLPGKEASGVISEVFLDGTLLVIPFEVPADWQATKEGVASPTHLHVDPRALSVRESSLAREFEAEILALPFDDQRYPPSELARKQCEVYSESRQGKAYAGLLSSVGYRFTTAHVVKSVDGKPLSFGERLSLILWQGAGSGTQYFGFEGEWIAERLREMQVAWLGECDTAGGIRRYRATNSERDSYYLTVRRSLEPDRKQRHQVVSVADDGSGKAIYTAPGMMLMARPLPFNTDRWLISSEGWRAPAEGNPGDPRWQAVYIVNINSPDEYNVVDYPIAQFPKPPANEHLYGGSEMLTADGKFLINTLYGFEHEGGGIWVADLSDEEFHARPEAFARVVAWDHTLSSMLLKNDADGASTFMWLFLTGKEVADDFAMTANILRVRFDGLASSIERQERLLQMVGWNPVPFAWQRLSEDEFRIAVETHYNYESSLLPRAHGVYFVAVSAAP